MRALRIVLGVVLGTAGVALAVFGFLVLVDYFGYGERDAPIPFVVGVVTILFLVPGAALIYLGGRLVRGRRFLPPRLRWLPR